MPCIDYSALEASGKKSRETYAITGVGDASSRNSFSWTMPLTSNTTVKSMNADKNNDAGPIKAHSKSNEIAISEENNHVRHMFSSAVGWFTLFMTANYFTAGWLVKSANETQSWIPVGLVSMLFLTQNMIGVSAFKETRNHFLTTNDRLKDYHDRIDITARFPVTPYDYCPSLLYASMIHKMIKAMRIMFIAWLLFLVVASCKEIYPLILKWKG